MLDLTVQPLIKSPFSKFNEGITYYNIRRECQPLFFRMLYCAESYGYVLADKKCKDYIDDIQECLIGVKRAQRVNKMRLEHRYRYFRGEDKEMFPDPEPKIDGY